MTIREVFASVERIRPNYLTDKEKRTALSRLECILRENDFKGFKSDDEGLSLPDEFFDIYVLYLKAEAENKLEEYERCNNTLAVFQTELQNFLRLKKRTSLPKHQHFKLF
jgi:hypothetical protein